MQRIPFNSNFNLKFEFLDLDGLPVSVKEADLDFFISTRPTTPPFKAYIIGENSSRALRLEDGSVLVPVPGNSLKPGKMKAVVNVKASLDHGRHGHHQQEVFVLHPEVPAELIEPDGYAPDHFHGHGFMHFNQDKPVVVRCVFNFRNLRLARHVTMGEMKAAIKDAVDNLPASGAVPADQSVIDDILSKFKVN